MSTPIGNRTEPSIGDGPSETSPVFDAKVQDEKIETIPTATEFELLGIDGQLKRLRLSDTTLEVSYQNVVGHIPFEKIIFVGTSHSPAYWPTMIGLALGIYGLYQGFIKSNGMFGILAISGCLLIFWLTYLGNRNRLLGRTFLAVKHAAGEERFISTQLDASIQQFVNALIRRVR